METKLENVQRIFSELCDKSYDDTFSVHEMLIDITTSNIEVILKFKRYIIPRIQTMVTAFNAAKQDLDATKQKLENKEEELRNVKECAKCSTLQKELAVMKKKQVVNESRIKSIAKILSRCDPETQDSLPSDADSDTDSDQSTVTKAYNLVSQMLGCDPLPSVPCEESRKVKTTRKLFKKKSPFRKPLSFRSHLRKNSKANPIIDQLSPVPKDSDEQEDTEDDVLVCSLEEIDKENDFETYCSPKKETDIKSASSPVLGKMKKTPVRSVSTLTPERDNHEMQHNFVDLEKHALENSFCIPPSPGRVSSRNKAVSRPVIQPNKDKDLLTDGLQQIVQSSDDKPKKKADFWQLKSTHFVDRNSVSAKKDGTKLRQSKLSVGCFPKKIDLCDMEEFNGGIRRSQTSTQISDIKNEKCGSPVSQTNAAVKHLNANDDDVVEDSPDTNISCSRRKGGRLFNSGRKLSFDVAATSVPRSKAMPQKPCTSGIRNASSSLNEIREAKDVNDSFDCLKKGEESPKYKYRGATVRKKSERQQLSGWDCENCRKYFEAAGGGDITEEERKKIMDRCSRHRDKHPARPRTPPGFWDAEFPPTPVCDELERTYMDVLPIAKRSKTKH
ncbi:hypothetical protein R5R35_014486 [Gryllus longicercus]|uniref:DNA endonuclease activator Ctp1 C-terminal domain-containing protein n=2 Tax=Gryllus longicercus TaxID=2509291 RepID=A0AAN9Z5W4_9ORTH